MTENLLTGRYSINTTKHKKSIYGVSILLFGIKFFKVVQGVARGQKMEVTCFLT